MRIPVLVEPDYRNSLWARQTLEGIAREAARKKYELVLLDAVQEESIDWDGLFGGERRLAVLMGTSMSWVPAAQARLAALGIACVLISVNPSQAAPAEGVISMNHAEATRTLLKYLRDCGREKTAFFALNPNSAADLTKQDVFAAWSRRFPVAAETNVFWNRGSLKECYEVFFPHVCRFDSVICANDIAAAALLEQLKKDGVTVPKELYLLSYGDSSLARALRPAITSASLNHDELGRRAVSLYAFLSRQEPTASVAVQVHCRVAVRESTENQPLHSAEESFSTPIREAVDFYSDGQAQRLMALETLLDRCDDNDRRLFFGLLRGEKPEALQQELFLSPSALRHREKNLMLWAGCAAREDWQAFRAFCRALPLLDE